MTDIDDEHACWFCKADTGRPVWVSGKVDGKHEHRPFCQVCADLHAADTCDCCTTPMLHSVTYTDLETSVTTTACHGCVNDGRAARLSSDRIQYAKDSAALGIGGDKAALAEIRETLKTDPFA